MINNYGQYSYRCYDVEEQEDLSVEAQMYDLRHDALERISKVVHPHYESKVEALLIEGYKDGLESAYTLARALDLHQGHMMALDYDFDRLKSYLRDERRDSRMMSHVESYGE